MSIGQTSATMALRDPGIRMMLRVRDDDPAAFGELVEEYQHRVVGVMYHVLGNSEEAEDMAQETFLRVYRSRKKYRPKAKFATWLFTIANNLALNAIRDRRKRLHRPARADRFAGDERRPGRPPGTAPAPRPDAPSSSTPN